MKGGTALGTAGRISPPPPFELVTLRERGDAFAHACAVAAEKGAATLVMTRRFDTVEFAVVLEPAEPLAEARRAFILCMGALAAALALHAPPDRPLAIRWPDSILLDGFVVGGGRLAGPAGTRESDSPAWLVFGAEINGEQVGDPDGVPTATSLVEAGLEAVDADALVADFAAALLRAQDRLTHDGFAAAAEPFLSRIATQKAGQARRLAANGDLLLGPAGERLALASALAAAPGWFAEMPR
ncbi:MAG: hypothetical protein IPL88_13615 [Rhizobiales bacterium]|nr:hypothetical protein [Hyphomicrobiales bacterium]